MYSHALKAAPGFLMPSNLHGSFIPSISEQNVEYKADQGKKDAKCSHYGYVYVDW